MYERGLDTGALLPGQYCADRSDCIREEVGMHCQSSFMSVPAVHKQEVDLQARKLSHLWIQSPGLTLAVYGYKDSCFNCNVIFS